MQTELNKKVKKFFEEVNLENITIEIIKKYFSDIEETNEYGGIPHAILNEKFPEEKVLKLLDILFMNGVDVNLCAKLTGYNFIQLALYGYTEDSVDKSYSTEFIVKLIEIARKYNLDVNLVDDDDDTIVHTAIASEVYLGEIVPIIKALGSNFNLENEDEINNNIYEALLHYKKEAMDSENKEWFERLEKEEKTIKNIVECSKYSLDDIEKIINDIKIKLNAIILQLDINYLVKNYIEISNLINTLVENVELQHLFVKEKTANDDLKEYYMSNIKLVISGQLQVLKNNPNLNIISQLEDILKTFSLENELEILLKIKEEYLQEIDKIKEKIKYCTTLNELNDIKESIESFEEEMLILELNSLFEDKKTNFIKEIKEIEELSHLINIVDEWLCNNSSLEEENFDNKLISYNNMTKENLVEIKKDKMNILGDRKNLIISTIQQQIINMINDASTLEELSIIKYEEVEEIICDSAKQYIKTRKSDKDE